MEGVICHMVLNAFVKHNAAKEARSAGRDVAILSRMVREASFSLGDLKDWPMLCLFVWSNLHKLSEVHDFVFSYFIPRQLYQLEWSLRSSRCSVAFLESQKMICVMKTLSFCSDGKEGKALN